MPASGPELGPEALVPPSFGGRTFRDLRDHLKQDAEFGGPHPAPAAGEALALRSPVLPRMSAIRCTSAHLGFWHQVPLLPNFGADVRAQVSRPPSINPIERNAVGGEFQRLLRRDARQAGFVGAPSRHVGS